MLKNYFIKDKRCENLFKNLLSVVVYSEEIDLPSIYKNICLQLRPYNFDAYIVVNNYDEVLHFIVSGCLVDKIKVIGSNEKYEFSGYKVILDYISNKKLCFERLFITNDTLINHGKLRLIERASVFLSFFSCKNKNFKTISGFKHKPNFIDDFNLPIKKYINSKFFIIGNSSVNSFSDAIVFSYNNVTIDNGNYIVEWSAEYDSFLKRWLNCNDEPCWYQAEALNKFNYQKFVRKSECILAEHRLSFYLLNECKGLNIIDLMPDNTLVKLLFRIRKSW